MENEINYTQLMIVIKDVHEEYADDLCWLSIDRIFLATGLLVPDRSTGDPDAMLINCNRFVREMCNKGKGKNWKSYVELEQEIIKLKEMITLLERKLYLDTSKKIDELEKQIEQLEQTIVELKMKIETMEEEIEYNKNNKFT